MSTITKERLQWLANISGRDDIDDIDGGEIRELARIALASLEVEPAIHRWRRVTVEPYGPYPWHYGNFIGFSKPVEGIEDEYFYSAPPSPVSVPDAYIRDERGRMMLNGRPEPRIGYGGGWNAFRAAMLQGADGNSPVIPDGWVMVPVEPTAEMLQSGISAHYERSQIQIHDRPAPGPMECAYVAMLAAAPQQEVKS